MQDSLGRQEITLAVLVHPAMSRHQVPQITTGPRCPGKGVVDIEAFRAKFDTCPDAADRLPGTQHGKRNRPRRGNVTVRIRPPVDNRESRQ